MSASAVVLKTVVLISSTRKCSYRFQTERNLTDRAYFRHDHMPIFGAGITHRTQQRYRAKARSPEFIEESTALLRTGNSRKPIALFHHYCGGKRLAQDNFGSIDRTAGLNHACQFGKDCCACRI